MSNNDLPISFNRASIVKHSKNIIDLIQVGDYVNGQEVVDIWKDESDEDKNYAIFLNKDWWKNDELKSIVTKEQFAQAEYKIKEDK